jgi:hypothetical protein
MEYTTFQLHEAAKRKEQEQLAAQQKLLSAAAASKLVKQDKAEDLASHLTPQPLGGDVMDIDLGTPSASKPTTASAIMEASSSEAVAATTGVSPAGDLDIDALFNDVASASTPNASAVQNQQQAGGDDEVDALFGGGSGGAVQGTDGEVGDGDGTMTSLLNLTGLPETSTTAGDSIQQTSTARGSTSQAAAAGGDFDFLSMMDFTDEAIGQGGSGDADANNGGLDDSGDFEKWLDSM